LKTTFLLFCIVVGGLWSTAAAQAGGGASGAAMDPAKRNAAWWSDLHYFETNFPTRQMNFERLIARDKFAMEMGVLEHDVIGLSDAEIVLQLTKIVAGLGVAQTTVVPGGAVASEVYPIRTQWFSDGLGVVYAGAAYRQALGARVMWIGTRTPEEVQTILAPYIAHENDARLRHDSPAFMMLAELMQKEKIAEADGDLRLTLVKPDGTKFVLDVLPTEADALSATNWISADAALHIPPPFYRQHLKPYYGYEFLDDSHTLYIQYNQGAEDSRQSFSSFTNALFTFADAHAVQRVIVDLRFNGGGDSRMVQPLLDGLSARPALVADGHLFVLMGSSTFSAGLSAAIDFRLKLHAILVGRPTGGKPNYFGEVKTLELPNSKVNVQYTTRYFREVDTDLVSLEPMVLVPYTLEDYLAGRDTIFEAALRR
jgi:hypothetical protein